MNNRTSCANKRMFRAIKDYYALKTQLEMEALIIHFKLTAEKNKLTNTIYLSLCLSLSVSLSVCLSPSVSLCLSVYACLSVPVSLKVSRNLLYQSSETIAKYLVITCSKRKRNRRRFYLNFAPVSLTAFTEASMVMQFLLEASIMASINNK